MAPSSALPATAAVVPVQTVDRNEIAAAAPRETVIAAPIAESHAAEVTELMPLLIAPRETERPSSRLLTASLARLEQPEADFTAAALHAAVRSPAPATTDELASVPASVSRRNRLLAQYEGRQFNPDPAPPEVLRERLTRRLGEPETSERSSRMVRDNDSFARPMPQIVALRF
jgi:hypothetical protein